jgi:hypothetical protein
MYNVGIIVGVLKSYVAYLEHMKKYQSHIKSIYVYNVNIFKFYFRDKWNMLGSYYKCIQGLL